MSENMYSQGQKTYTKEGMKEFDRIFKKKCKPDCDCGDKCKDKK